MTLKITYTEEQIKMIEKSKTVFTLSKEQNHILKQKLVKESNFPSELWQAYAKAGFMGCLIPKEYGGSDTGVTAFAQIVENQTKQTGYPHLLPILTQMSALCITRHGSNHLKDQFLSKIASGDTKCCIAATEAHSGMNMFAINTFAEKRDEHYIINGSKCYISGADIADYMLCYVRTKTVEDCKKAGLPKTAGFSLFMVDTKLSGIKMEKMPVHGDLGLHPQRIEFDNVCVPESNLIGQENNGVSTLFEAANLERILMGSAVLGIAKYCLNLAVPYSIKRKIFGEAPIGQYQAIQYPLAEIQIRQESINLLASKAATLFDQQAGAAEVSYYANCVKYLASQVGVDVVDTAIETLGGKGFDENGGLIHLWEFVRLFKTTPISNTIILSLIAEQCLKLPKSY